MKKRKWYSLYDKVYALGNLERAWEKVRSNGGAGGVDRQSIDSFEVNRDRNLAELQRLLREKRYRPLPLRRVYIPKSNGERRPLGIPAIRDRVVQQALLNILEPILEPLFHDHSYGFRPGRSAHQAIQRVQKSLETGKEWVLDVDIRKYFDTVNHELLLEKVNEEISDGSVLKLIRMFLEAGVLEEGVCVSTETGTPQGGVISPLLANLYLNGLDWQMSSAGYEMIRYADDLVVMCSSQSEAQEAWERLRVIIEGELKLQIHSEKTRILFHRQDSFEFLGFLLHRRYLWPRIQTINRFKERVRILTRRQQAWNLQEVIVRVNYTLRGFGNYYRIADVKGLFSELELP